MQRFGIVGCGLTGAVAAMLLKQRLPHVNITILEKSKGTGGRMSTSRGPFGSSVDLGAQFITKTSNLTLTQKECYKQLLDAGLLQQFQDDIEGIRAAPNSTHFICPQGSGSLVKYFVNKADCDILFQHRVIELNTVNNKWMALCENGSNFEFDAVILTLPVPQVLQLKGITSQLSDDHLNKLKAVEYCSRFALGCFFEKDYEFFKNSSWSGKFLSDNIIRFCSIDHCKRGSSGLPSVAIHTTKEFGKLHIDDSNLSTIQDTVIQRLKELFPEMPLPSQIKFHKWRYSQAEKSCQVQGSLKLAENPYLICGGDGFTYSTFEGCILSAESIADNLAKKSYL